ncbi:MAG: hypothetical protein ACRDYV_00210 [Acidimicrobiia bacterium]
MAPAGETIGDPDTYSGVVNELVGLGRRKPDHTVEVSADTFAHIADAWCKAGFAAGYRRGTTEPVAVNVKEVKRDAASGGISRIVEYQGSASRLSLAGEGP